MAKLEDHRDDVNKAIDNALKIAFVEIGLQMEANAVMEVNAAVYDTPESPNYVRTGRLRSSITHRSEDRQATVGSNVEYSPYVEFGTSKGAPRPFIRPTIENHLSEYENILATELDSISGT